MNSDGYTTYERNTEVGRTVEVLCTKCSGKTEHTIHANYLSNYSYSDSGNSFDGCTDYQIIQCNGCKLIRFREVSSNSEDLYPYYDDNGETQVECRQYETIYPPRRTDKKRLSDDEQWSLPDFLRNIYSETNNAIASGLPLLAAAGLRAITETICNDFINKKEQENKKETPKVFKVKVTIEIKNSEGISKTISVNLCERSLPEKIDWLVNEGYLSKSSNPILKVIKGFGDDSVHHIKPQSIKDLERALEVLETMMRTLYIHNEKFISKSR